MGEVLYIVNTRETNKGKRLTVIATLEKNGNKYLYKPHNLDNDAFPRAEVAVETTGLPAVAQRRLFNKNRPDISRILAKYDLDHYDEWELLKRTNGMLVTDNILYVTRRELHALKRNMNTIDYFGTEEAVALSL